MPRQEGGRAASEVHGHIEDSSPYTAHQLVFCVRRVLEMEAPDCPAATSKRVIDLRDGTIKAGVSEFLRAKETTEEASLVLRTLPLDD